MSGTEHLSAIVQQIKGTNEEDAAAALVELIELVHHQVRVWLRTHFISSADEDLDDALQTAWGKIWEVRESLDPKRSIRAFIFRIAHNEVVNIIRLQCRTDAVDAYKLESSSQPSARSNTQEPPPYGLSRENQQLNNLLSGLSLADRLILETWAIGDGDAWVTDDLKKRTGLNAGALRVRRLRIVKRLKEAASSIV